jgi:hypothetical protein
MLGSAIPSIRAALDGYLTSDNDSAYATKSGNNTFDGYITFDKGSMLSQTSISSETYLDGSKAVVFTDSTSEAFTVWLPDATNVPKIIIVIKDIGHATEHPITISAANAGQSVDGASVSISTNYGSFRVTSYNGNWYTI